MLDATAAPARSSGPHAERSSVRTPAIAPKATRRFHPQVMMTNSSGSKAESSHLRAVQHRLAGRVAVLRGALAEQGRQRLPLDAVSARREDVAAVGHRRTLHVE